MVTSGQTTGLTIRAATAADAPKLARLIEQLGYSASEPEVIDRLATMQQEERVVLVAELEGKVVGCLSTSTMRVLHRPALVGRISMMVVDEALRGQGIGAALVHAAERALTAAGCQLVEVTSHLTRTDAHRFYERLGYERTSVRLARQPGSD